VLLVDAPRATSVNQLHEPLPFGWPGRLIGFLEGAYHQPVPQDPGSVTSGIDLASQPSRTAICAIEWSHDRAVARFEADTSDAHIVEVIESAAKVGVDCPLGWPEPFVRAVTAHSQMADWPGREHDQAEYRRTLTQRETDRVIQRFGRQPLSVSTDRIGIVAMRFAGIADALARRGHPVDRTGRGVVAEVYPAAALRAWGLSDRGYKRNEQAPALAALVDGLVERIPWLRFADGSAEESCRRSHDAFDALISALVARAVQLDRTTWPDTDEGWRLACIEGWIHVPSSDPAALLG